MLEILSGIARELLGSFLLDVGFLPVYIIAVHLIKGEYKKYYEYRENISAVPGQTIRRQVEESILFGLLGGFIASVAAVSLKISVNSGTLGYLLLIMVVLAVIDLRYACFPYAAGILVLSGSLFGSNRFEAGDLLMLAALVQMVESILVLFRGSKDCLPVYFRHEDGIAGAFLSRKFWPMPVVLFTFMLQGTNSPAANPLMNGGLLDVQPESVGAMALALSLDCLVSLAGYSDMAITRQPENKSHEMGLFGFAYGALLLFAGILVRDSSIPGFLGAVFSVAVREGYILYGYFREKNGVPLFKAVRRGLRVLDVLPGSHAEKMGMKRGDVILYINGKGIQTEEGMKSALSEFPTFVWVDIIRQDDKTETLQYRCFPEGLGNLGIITVPREKEVTYNVDHFQRLVVLKNLVSRFKNMNKSA